MSLDEKIKNSKAMKTVKKYETFEELKSSEKKILNQTESLRKHEEFEKVIKGLKSTKV